MKLHNAGRLAVFRAAGVASVGVLAERLPPATNKPRWAQWDQAQGHLDKRTGPGSRTRGQTPSPSTIGRIGKVQAELEAVLAGGSVEVVTAGDDRVCDICDGIAANGPYSLDQAEARIPAHPNCRCSFAPFNGGSGED